MSGRKGNLIVTATSHVESSNRLVADIFVNEASGVGGVIGF